MITRKQIAEILIAAINAGAEDPAKAESNIEAQTGGAELLDAPILELINKLTLRDVITIAKGTNDTPAA